MPKAAHLAGHRYGRLVVLHRTKRTLEKWNVTWLCQCDCGKQVLVVTKLLNNGAVRSCGCLRWTGDSARTHGRTETTEYQCWCGIKKRCYNPKDRLYKYYGARGITVCDRWRRDFEEFLTDMGLKPTPSHSIERRDNMQGYSPENCYWATRIEQMNNRRTTRWLTWNGEVRPLTYWARQIGILPNTLRARLDQHHWSIEKALTTLPK